MIVGKRRASMVFPKPMTSDPPLRLERRIVIPREFVPVAEWVSQEAGRHLCGCGCGNAIQIRPIHHWKGIPTFLHGHHVALMRREVGQVRAAGLLTAPEAMRNLGVSQSTLTRLERKLGLPIPRAGKHRLRGYAPEHLDALRSVLGPGVAEAGVTLFYMDQVAKRAGCKPHTVAHRRGVDLPTGRWVTHPRRGWTFTADEVAEVVAQLKRRPRLLAGRAGDVDATDGHG
jgi:hypothetical protein